MKKFIPYFKLLIPVKWRFALAISAGIIYGVASGFGLPFMTYKVFPILFSSDSQGVVVAVKSKPIDVDGLSTINFKKYKAEHFDLGVQEDFALPGKLFRKEADSAYKTLPEGSRYHSDGYVELPDQSRISLGELFFEKEGEYRALDNSLYLKNSKGEYNIVASGESIAPNKWTLFWSVMMLPGVFLIRGVFGYINTYQITYCGSFVLEQIRSKTFRKMQRLDLAFFQRHGSGDLMTRLMTEAARLQQMLTAASNDLIKQPVTFLGALAALIWLSIQQKEVIFILICLGIIPVMIFPLRKLTKRMLDRMRKGAIGEGELGNRVQENLMAVRDIRSFNLEDREVSRFENALQGFFRMMMKMTKYRALVTPTVEVITAAGISLAIFMSSQNGLTLEKVLPLIMALYMSYEPLKRMGQLQNQLVLGAVAIERIEGILNAPEGVKDPVNPKPLPPIEGAISFKDLTFNYEQGQKGMPALDQINVEIKPDEVIALVGPSGAGKSTFTHLISRTYEFNDGELLFDGHDVHEHRLHDIRGQVSVVSQDPYLFNESVMNNIRLGRLDASEAEIREAARLAHCQDFIDELPQKYETVVGEKATRLSGGQRQRLAIARAFLKNAPILILDEATSALDAESEQAVQGALEQLVKGRTTLIIAHRFSSIQIATRILVFDKGRIAGDGTHEELMQTLPLYQELYSKQMLA